MFPALSFVPVAQAGDLRAYQGGQFRVLVAPAQTRGAFALLDLTLPQGAEPPRQVHDREDEAYYLLEGEVAFEVGGVRTVAQAGQAVFAPRQVPHQLTIATPAARLLLLLTPGQLVEHFMAFSGPLRATRAVQGPPPFEVLLAMTYALRHRGVQTC